MMTKICEKCDHEMRLVPAGISKTKNKPYSAFWSCDARNGGCGATARAEGEAAQPAPDYMGGAAPAPAVDNSRLEAMEAKLDQLIAMVKDLQGL